VSGCARHDDHVRSERPEDVLRSFLVGIGRLTIRVPSRGREFVEPLSAPFLGWAGSGQLSRTVGGSLPPKPARSRDLRETHFRKRRAAPCTRHAIAPLARKLFGGTLRHQESSEVLPEVLRGKLPNSRGLVSRFRMPLKYWWLSKPKNRATPDRANPMNIRRPTEAPESMCQHYRCRCRAHGRPACLSMIALDPMDSTTTACHSHPPWTRCGGPWRPGPHPSAARRSRPCPLVPVESRGRRRARVEVRKGDRGGIVRPRVCSVSRRCASSSGFTEVSAAPCAAIVANRGVPRAGASGSRVPSNVFPNARLRQGVEADPFPLAVGRDRLELFVVQDRDNPVHAI